MLSAITFISSTLGADFVESQSIKLDDLFASSNSRVPLICILSPGIRTTDISALFDNHVVLCHVLLQSAQADLQVLTPPIKLKNSLSGIELFPWA